MKKFLLLPLLILVLFLNAGTNFKEDSTLIAPIVKTISSEMNNEKTNVPGFSWQLTQIAYIPEKFVLQSIVPSIAEGHIVSFDGHGGVVWYSGTMVGDSAYVVVKSTYGTTLYWWKCNSTKRWYPTKIFR